MQEFALSLWRFPLFENVYYGSWDSIVEVGFGVPHSSQNLAEAGLTCPQGPVHPAASAGFGVPHPLQNLADSGFTLPQGPVQVLEGGGSLMGGGSSQDTRMFTCPSGNATATRSFASSK